MNTQTNERYCLECRDVREVYSRTCPTCGHSHEACTECCNDQLEDIADQPKAIVRVAPRADGEPRMTTAQLDILWRKCGDYNVPFREDDYYLYPTDAAICPGWAEGWIGGDHYSGRRSGGR